MESLQREPRNTQDPEEPGSRDLRRRPGERVSGELGEIQQAG